MRAPATKAQAEKLLRRLFRAGALKHLPRNRHDMELLIALAGSALDPRAVYTENEVNELLIDWMAGFTDEVSLDHVTIRRYLVDYRILFRGDDGTDYRTNQAVLASFIEPDARSVIPRDIFLEVQQDREQRRRSARTPE